ncbi:tetratricopeptide repeat-containing diguanylate cyclase [Fusibacter tunisiensis]|uniref:Diguanylate cyclase (GGDEF)-like protein n=1 Tax=Fusibacter tunisiensis TaxID=1008308 RepID=A0ABS2MN50_9FIRM|nr:diguanylate cyclase [Fusibacter tunisiensis]MBM7560829.1 diguanylate cyclase (GGDEF)-like protein [Fusibacter tunisiensis]
MNRLEIIEKIEKLEGNPKVVIDTLSSQLDLEGVAKAYDEAFNYYLYGRAILLAGKQEAAIRPLNLALDYFERVNSKFGRFNCYSSLGIAYREIGELHLATDSFEKAYHLSYEMEDFAYLIKALMNLGSIYANYDKINKALEMLEKALEYKAYIEGTKTLGDLYNNYAYVLLENGDLEKPLAYFYKAMAVYEAHYGNVNHINVLIVKANIGETYLLLNQLDEAENYLKRVLEEALAEDIDFIAVDCLRNLSQVYAKQGQYKLALETYQSYAETRKKVESVEISEEVDKLKERLIEETTRSEQEIDLLRNVELKNKTRELEKTLKSLSLIGEIGQKLTASMDMGEIYGILRKSIYDFMEADVFGLALYDDVNEKIIYKYFEQRGVDMPLIEVSLHDTNSLAAYAIYHGQDIYIQNFAEEYHTYIELINPIGTESSTKHANCIIYCRLISENRIIGLITLQHYEPFAYTESDFEVLKALASYLAIAISNAQKKSLISEKAKELEYLSYNDPLTGLYNRRYFNEVMSKFLDLDHMPLGLVMADMNCLKLINDTHGHLMGDQYLVEAAKILRDLADCEYVFRLGGDEFAILMPSSKPKAAQKLIEKIKEQAQTIDLVGVPLSLALGYEFLEAPDAPEARQKLFSDAENNMYLDKRQMKDDTI